MNEKTPPLSGYIFIYTTVIKLIRKPDLIVWYEKFAGRLRHISFEFQIKEHKSGFQRIFRS